MALVLDQYQIIDIIKDKHRQGKNLQEKCALWPKSLEVKKDGNKYNMKVKWWKLLFRNPNQSWGSRMPESLSKMGLKSSNFLNWQDQQI